jgi:uncharacterized YccA/Bax inhibitor family protein
MTNPIFSRMNGPVVSNEELAQIVNGPGAGRLSIHDVIMKTTSVFALLVVGAGIGWSIPSLLFPAMIVALVLGLVNSFKKNVSPALVLTYGLTEGVFLGGLSYWFETAYGPGIAKQAVLGTLVAFGVMLAMYQNKIIQVNEKFTKIFMVSMVSYAVIALISFVTSFFGVGNGLGFYGVGGLGILLCMAGVALATFSLVMDFEMINRGIAQGLPEKESWRMAFGLVLSLVWLYTELLRLLAIIRGDD